MPEGDTVARAAADLHRALAGAVLIAVEGSHPAIRRRAARLVDRRVEGVRSHGKHLLVDLAGGLTIRTHLGMSGAWHLYRPGERWRRPQGAARVVLTTDHVTAVCFAAPTVEVERRQVMARALEELGPDVVADGFDEATFLSRAAERASGRTVAELLLDQRVLSGVGNVYKNEVLFLERLNPTVPATALPSDRMLALARRARRLVRANLDPTARATTGDHRRGRRLWVHGRAGRPCRRCGGPISDGWLGTPPRISYWCPTCQR